MNGDFCIEDCPLRSQLPVEESQLHSESQRACDLVKVMGPERGWFQEGDADRRGRGLPKTVSTPFRLPRLAVLSSRLPCWEIRKCPRGDCALRRALHMCAFDLVNSSLLFIWVAQTLRCGCESDSLVRRWSLKAPVGRGEMSQGKREGLYRRPYWDCHWGWLLLTCPGCPGEMARTSLWDILTRRSESWGICPLTPISSWLRPASGGCGNSGLPWAKPTGSGGQRKPPR